MYDKIAQVMNRDYDTSDMDGELVESYLRHGDMTHISVQEAYIIDELLERFL